jgi:carbamoyl-phosphate synthase small subunit
MNNKMLPGILALEDGSVFRGEGFGAEKTVVGEAVFNTSMTGYQEILTDPSYYGQIITMTASQIGNYGINTVDVESDGPKVRGFVLRELSPIASNWRSEMTLDAYLSEHGVPGITGVDTRAITKKLRLAGAMKACISTEAISDKEAVRRAREWEGLVGRDFVKEVSTPAKFQWDSEAETNRLFRVPGTILEPLDRFRGRERLRIAALDFGAKLSIYRNLSRHGFDITVLPADTSAEEIEALQPDGVFLSNGPGDPEPVKYAQETVRTLVGKFPLFGICLGHQILSLALGVKTYKLKFGHRGGNQPVKNIETGKVMITAQNHGFASRKEDFEGCDAMITELNMNDDTVAGLRHKTLPVFSVQYHPEAAPGPNDAVAHFDEFYRIVKAHKDAKLAAAV